MRLDKYYVLLEVERTGNEIKIYLNDYLGVDTEDIRKAMKTSMIKNPSCCSHKKTDRRLLLIKTGIHTQLQIFLALHWFQKLSTLLN
jgi:hypothetical protein